MSGCSAMGGAWLAVSNGMSTRCRTRVPVAGSVSSLSVLKAASPSSRSSRAAWAAVSVVRVTAGASAEVRVSDPAAWCLPVRVMVRSRVAAGTVALRTKVPLPWMDSTSP